ncbi:MAG: type VI secretion system baseplate subunit TssG [Desulfovibrionales bacterium]|nr:MAG: type VI secretion system baseplate subunit TssG [Desulfovibrionales bacterium]
MADPAGRSHSPLKTSASTSGTVTEARAGSEAIGSRSDGKRRRSVLENLIADPRGFSYVQALRLLRQAYGGPGISGERTFLREQLRVRPYLSLGFPPTDLVEIKEISGEKTQQSDALRRFQMTATFLGLYGPSSPLPTFYTEELLDEQNEDSKVSRDFLDILNHGFFVLFALADAHYRLCQQACEKQDEDILLRLFALVGLGHQEMRDHAFDQPGALLRATGLLTQFPRSAVGLRGVLSDRIGAPVQVVPCQPRMATIPEDQRCRLGREANVLGRSAWIGDRVADAMGKIRIVIGPLDADTFQWGVPGETGHDEVIKLVRFYCTQPLEFDLEFILAPQEAQPGRLGDGRWSRLGCDVWLTAEPLAEGWAVFPERRRIWDDHQQRSIVL